LAYVVGSLNCECQNCECQIKVLDTVDLTLSAQWHVLVFANVLRRLAHLYHIPAHAWKVFGSEFLWHIGGTGIIPLIFLAV